MRTRERENEYVPILPFFPLPFSHSSLPFPSFALLSFSSVFAFSFVLVHAWTRVFVTRRPLCESNPPKPRRTLTHFVARVSQPFRGRFEVDFGRSGLFLRCGRVGDSAGVCGCCGGFVVLGVVRGLRTLVTILAFGKGSGRFGAWTWFRQCGVFEGFGSHCRRSCS